MVFWAITSTAPVQNVGELRTYPQVGICVSAALERSFRSYIKRRRTIALLAPRVVLRSTTDQYCGAHRGGEYALAAAVALPNAIQVADRWGMPAVPLSTRPGNPCGEIPAAIGITTINSRLLTATERIQYEGYLRREETNGAILAWRRTGPPLGRSWSHRT